jgi:hypothetical protein
MQKTIKAILIDAENKEVREVTLSTEIGCFNQEMYKELKCEYITSACSEIFGVINHALFVDDEGLLKTHPIGAFCVSLNPRPYTSQTLSGNGILVGIDEEGETISHNLDIDIIRNIIVWEDISNLPEPSFEFQSF